MSGEAGVAVSQAPAPGARQASKCRRRAPRDGRIMKQRGNGEGLDLARKGSLGGGVRLGVDAGAGRDSSSESLLNGSEAAPPRRCPRGQNQARRRAEVAAGGEACDVGGGACSRADRAPIPPEVMPREATRQSSSEREGPTRRPAKGEANVGVGGEEDSWLRTGRHGAAGIQDLSPPRTGPEKAKKAPLSIRKASRWHRGGHEPWRRGGQGGPHTSRSWLTKCRTSPPY